MVTLFVKGAGAVVKTNGGENITSSAVVMRTFKCVIYVLHKNKLNFLSTFNAHYTVADPE